MMDISQMRITFFIFSIIAIFPSSSHGATVLVDVTTHWKTPTVNIGDSIIFRHKDHFSLYIFRSKLAFNLCNFNQSTLLSNPNSSSSYTWRPSRIGSFYFSFNNGTDKPCQQGQKIAVKVVLSPAPAPAPEISVKAPQSPPDSVALPPTPGGVVSSSPAFPWRPREKSGTSPAPTAAETTAMAPLVPGGNGGSAPFLDSNPAEPLPTGEVDSATIRPLPVSDALPKVQVVGLLGLVLPQCISILLLL